MHSPDQCDTALDQIEFDLDIEAQDDESDALIVHVVPLINGLPFLMAWRSTPFEFLAVMAIGSQAGEAWPFNCECGMPECAGFYSPMQINADDQLIYWHLPTELAAGLSVSRKGQATATRLQFDLIRYMTAFRKTFQQLQELERQHGRLKLGVIDGARGSLAWGLTRETNWAETRRLRREILRDFDDGSWHLLVQSKTGLQMSIELNTVVDFKLNRHTSGALYDHAQCCESLITLINQLLIDPSLVIRDLDPNILATNLHPVISTKEFDQRRVLREHGLHSGQDSLEPWIELRRTATVSLRQALPG